MSNISSTDAWSVKLMRWVARLLSVPWAYWMLLWTFIVAALQLGWEPDSLTSLTVWMVFIIIMVIALLLFMGAAIIASVWGKEAFGGGVLLVDGVLIIASIIIIAYLPDSPSGLLSDPEWIALELFTMVLPPWVAGSLFLICHRKSQTSGEQDI